MAVQHRAPTVVACILERVTNIALGAEIDLITGFEAIDCRAPRGLATAGRLDCNTTKDTPDAKVCRQPLHAVDRAALP